MEVTNSGVAWKNLKPPTKIVKTSTSGGFSISTSGEIKIDLQRSYHDQYFEFNKSFTEKKDGRIRGIRFLFARGMKKFRVIEDDSAPLSNYRNQDIIKFRCFFKLDKVERDRYNFDISLVDPLTNQEVFNQKDIRIADVIVKNTSDMKRDVYLYTITLHKSG